MNSTIMTNSTVNSPNSTFETEDTIKMNSSMISSASTSNNNYHNSMVSNHNYNDQFYQYDTSLVNGPFNPLPPPPISINQSMFQNPNMHHNTHSNSNFNSSSVMSSTGSSNIVNHEYAGNVALGSNTSDYHSTHDFSLPNSSHYSIFSNHQAMNSTTSFHNDTHPQHQQIFKLNMDSTSDILNEYSISTSQNADLMYNLTEFELGNPSLESIPDTMLHHHSHVFNTSSGLSQSLTNPSNLPSQPFHDPNTSFYDSTNDVSQYPYTPTISDAYTPTLSESSSYTPNSSGNNVLTTNINNSSVDLSQSQNSYHEEVAIRAPVPVSIKSQSYSNSSPNLGSHKISKKPSIARMSSNSALNTKKSLVISTQINNSTNNIPLGESSPQTLGISPLCNKYKGLEIFHQPSPISARSASNASNCSSSSSTSVSTPNKPLMPPLNIFRHNSDSSTQLAYETPRRKTYPNLSEVSHQKSRKQTMRKTSKGALVLDPGSSTPIPMSTPSTISSESKKKYTRRRLLPRSKNGCWICRIKHLKCDEARPVCTSCSKFGIDCDYSPTKPGYVTDKALRKEKLLSISVARKQKSSSGKSITSRLKSEQGYDDDYGQDSS